MKIQGRIFNRDFIYRKRAKLSRYGVKGLTMFNRIDFGRRTLYISKKPTAFHNMQGVVSSKERDYVIHSV